MSYNFNSRIDVPRLKVEKKRASRESSKWLNGMEWYTRAHDLQLIKLKSYNSDKRNFFV